MHFILFAADYDGTLANDGIVDEPTAAALDRLRASGRKLVLVTGRHLSDLQNIFPKLNEFDRVIVENGGVLYRPETREQRLLCDPPDRNLIAALKSRGVPFAVGRAVIATWRPHDSEVLAAIHDLRLDLQVIFNKESVMVLPLGVDKSTALQAALDELAVSPHNVVAVGDAENDLPLLRISGCSVAVANALPSLKHAADIVLEKPRGEGVINLIDRIIADDLAELGRNLQCHSISLGDQVDDESDSDVKRSAIMRR